MLFRQLFDRETCTYTYLLADEESREAVLIDSVLEQVDRDAKLIEELGLTLRYVLDTHVHADHVTGAGRLRELFGAQTVVAVGSGVDCADRLAEDGDVLEFGSHALLARSTPGHTNGDLSFILGEGGMAFTGDTLLIRGCGRTDFQQGDARTLYRSVHDIIFALPDDTLLYPGHDYKGRTVTTVGEERVHNLRLGGDRSEDAFVELMRELRLPYPAKLAAALPANHNCGVTEAKVTQSADGWAPIERTEDGVPEVSVEWMSRNPLASGTRVVDVRSAQEFHGRLGHLPGSLLIPAETLATEVAGWERREPVVVVCRSGRRSAAAAAMLERMGFVAVASMRGGLLAWAEAGSSR